MPFRPQHLLARAHYRSYDQTAMNAYELSNNLVAWATCPQRGRPVVDPPSRTLLVTIWSDVSHELASLAAAMGLPADQVEDLLHEVYVTACQEGPACGDGQELKWWLIRVTINRCRLVHRRQSRWRRMWEQVARLRSIVATGDQVRDGAVVREEREVVARALDELPARQRAVLVLRYYEDYDSKQIGRMLGMPDSTFAATCESPARRWPRS